MTVRRPAWCVASCVSNLLAFACFVASAWLAEQTPKLIVLGLGFGVAGLYLFAVSCKSIKE